RAEVIGLWHHPYPPSRSNMDWRGTDPLAPAAGPARGIRQQKFWAEKWSFKMGAMLFLQARVAIESKLGRPRLRRGNACAPPPPCPDLLRERRFPELICLRRRGRTGSAGAWRPAVRRGGLPRLSAPAPRRAWDPGALSSW